MHDIDSLIGVIRSDSTYLNGSSDVATVTRHIRSGLNAVADAFEAIAADQAELDERLKKLGV